MDEVNGLAAEISALTILSGKTQVDPDSVDAGRLPVTSAMLNVWANRIASKRQRIKDIVSGWV